MSAPRVDTRWANRLDELLVEYALDVSNELFVGALHEIVGDTLAEDGRWVYGR